MRPGERHGHPRRGRRAGLRSGYRATLLEPLDESSFAYLLSLSPTEALLESASFGPVLMGEGQKTLLRYLRARHPGAGFTVTHAESGCIPLGFAPPRTSGPRHILLGTKRGLIKPSAGYGVVCIAAESEHLARLWRENRPLPPSRRSAWWWRFLDTGFLRLCARSTPALGPATARHGRGSPRPIAALHRRRSRASTVAPACTDGPTSRPRQENVVAEDGTSAGDTVSRGYRQPLRRPPRRVPRRGEPAPIRNPRSYQFPLLAVL